ncbi:hypothetical protein B0T11DRAFT_22079 [Plectosphaerella cucumerina]|uniref:Uncharacterized protein n=1 Tax=Plectosphaerella cucumerina TaxID=40658 RepID=A0A8K0TUR8_9PEZI|nr:hypothetical protein B0T11DRAFT_22079 [Plectosphaerella cucumerina]
METSDKTRSLPGGSGDLWPGRGSEIAIWTLDLTDSHCNSVHQAERQQERPTAQTLCETRRAQNAERQVEDPAWSGPAKDPLETRGGCKATVAHGPGRHRPILTSRQTIPSSLAGVIARRLARGLAGTVRMSSLAVAITIPFAFQIVRCHLRHPDHPGSAAPAPTLYKTTSVPPGGVDARPTYSSLLAHLPRLLHYHHHQQTPIQYSSATTSLNNCGETRTAHPTLPKSSIPFHTT